MKDLIFIGDLIFGDQPITFGYGFDSTHYEDKYENSFKHVKHKFDDKYVVANFESVIKERDNDKSNVSNWSMCCDETVCKRLIDSNIKIVSMANNHTMDYGEKWFNHTKKCLQDSKIKILGLKNKPYEILDVGDEKVAIIGVSYLKVKQKNVLYFNSPSIEEWKKVLKELEGVDKKIVYIHWGNEFISIPNVDQVEISKQLSKLGIDMIIGHHPHILQKPKVINDIPVYFSLGNFISDYWQKRLRKTTILSVNIKNLKKIKETSCLINKFGVPIIEDEVEYDIESFTGQTSNKFIINRCRMRVRVEYLLKILMNFYRIKNKKLFLKWFYKRLKYFVFNFYKELRNPEIIYEKYEA